MSERLLQYFQEYADAHKNPTCQRTHKLAIPLIFFSTFVALNWLNLGEFPPDSGLQVGLGHIWYAGTLVWYARLSPKLTLIMALLGVGIFAAGPHVPRQMIVGLWLVGWVIQGLGHAIWEKNRPAFLTNLAQMYIGPIFFIAVLLGDWPRPSGTTTAPK